MKTLSIKNLSLAAAICAVTVSPLTAVFAGGVGLCNTGHGSNCYLFRTVAGGQSELISYRNGRWNDAQGQLLRWGDATWTPMVGDWNGDGVDEFGLYAHGHYRLRMYTGAVNYEVTGSFGPEVEIGGYARPVVGNWDGEPGDSIGVYNEGRFTLLADFTDPSSTIVIDFGTMAPEPGTLTDPLPFAGNVDNNPEGISKVGIVAGILAKFAKTNEPNTYSFYHPNEEGTMGGILPLRPFTDAGTAVLYRSSKGYPPSYRLVFFGVSGLAGPDACWDDYDCEWFDPPGHPSGGVVITDPGPGIF